MDVQRWTGNLTDKWTEFDRQMDILYNLIDKHISRQKRQKSRQMDIV